MRHAVILIVLSLALSAPAAAQDRTSAFVGGSVSAANMAKRTEVAFAGLFGYRFSRVVSFVIEATVVPDVRSSFPVDSPFIQTANSSTANRVSSSSVVVFPGPFFSNPGGRIVLFTNTARIDIPTTSSRVTPFFAAGGGVANVRRTADFSIPFPLPLAVPMPIEVRPITQRVTSSSTDLALTLGGGVGVRVASSLWVDVDLRVFRLFGDEDQNLGRFGVGVRYAF